MQKKFTLLVILVAILLYIVSPRNLFTSMTAFADEANSNSSTIGGVSVSGLSRHEIKQVLTDAINDWTLEPILITGGGSELTVDAKDLKFDIDASINVYESLTDKPWFNFWADDKLVQIPLELSQFENVKSEISKVSIWDTEETVNKVIAQASYLKSHEIEAKVINLSILENERLALTIEEIPEDAKDIQKITQIFDKKILNQNEIFSFLESIGESNETLNSIDLNFVASVLYNTILQTNFAILERHSQDAIPPYLQPGTEALVSKEAMKDLRFENSSSSPVLIKTTVENNRLKLEIYSSVNESEVDVRVNRDEIIAPRIINRYSSKLSAGQTELIQEGKEGLRVSVYRTITKNRSVEEEKVSRDYYAPTNRIVLNSSRPIITPEIIQDNNDLNLDLNGDGLPDYDSQDSSEIPSNNIEDQQLDELPHGSYYDKGGNLVTP